MPFQWPRKTSPSTSLEIGPKNIRPSGHVKEEDSRTKISKTRNYFLAEHKTNQFSKYELIQAPFLNSMKKITNKARRIANSKINYELPYRVRNTL